MYEHHERTIARLVERFHDDEAFLAIVVTGSVGRRTARETSDVDAIIVATDEEYARRRKEGALHYITFDLCDYEGGYIDGKIVGLRFLNASAERGTEPARAQFQGAQLAFSRLPELATLLKRIPVYQENERAEKMKSFWSQMQAHQWFLGEAEPRGNSYLLASSAAKLALFGGRLILAHNRILFPGHKDYVTSLRSAPEKPVELIDLLEALVRNPSCEAGKAFCDCLYSFADWEQPDGGWVSRFMQDTEWNWADSKVSLEEI